MRGETSPPPLSPYQYIMALPCFGPLCRSTARPLFSPPTVSFSASLSPYPSHLLALTPFILFTCLLSAFVIVFLPLALSPRPPALFPPPPCRRCHRHLIFLSYPPQSRAKGNAHSPCHIAPSSSALSSVPSSHHPHRHPYRFFSPSAPLPSHRHHLGTANLPFSLPSHLISHPSFPSYEGQLSAPSPFPSSPRSPSSRHSLHPTPVIAVRLFCRPSSSIRYLRYRVTV